MQCFALITTCEPRFRCTLALAAALALAVAFLGGCGQRGPLYLPENAPAPRREPRAPAPPAVPAQLEPAGAVAGSRDEPLLSPPAAPVPAAPRSDRRQ